MDFKSIHFIKKTLLCFYKMPPFFGHLTTIGFGTELIYSFVIVVCCLMVYFGTKEIYELSSHKGIKYFRQTFLFFAGAYFFRFFIKFVLILFGVNFRFSPMMFGILTMLVFMYFSSMAIFSLGYSIIWKKWDKKFGRIYLFHFFAVVIAMASIFLGNILIYFGLNMLLFFFIILVVYIAHKNFKNKKRKHNLHAIYILLSAFWILNVIDILVPNFFETFQLLIYLASIGVFLTILYKVLKKTGSG